MTRCEVNVIFKGKVAAVQNYGAFVEIPGCKQQGLIHKSQVSSTWVDDMNEILKRGESVWCKIISIGDDGKIGLSMKFVNQGNGKDLDPNGVELHREEQRKKPIPKQRKPIELQAVLNSICKKCKLKGHFEHDCFTPLDGKKYDLLPEVEDDDEQPLQLIQQQQVPEEDKSQKSDKKSKSKKVKKKKSKKKRSVSTSSDDSYHEEEKRHKKKKKKHSKQKKRKHSESSSDYSSDNGHKEKHSKKCKHSRSKPSD